MLNFIAGHWWQITLFCISVAVLSESRALGIYSRESALLYTCGGLVGVAFFIVLNYGLLQPAIVIDLQEAQSAVLAVKAQRASASCDLFCCVSGTLLLGIAVHAAITYVRMILSERSSFRVYG